MENRHLPISWITEKYSVPYTTNVLGTETISSLAQKLAKNKKIPIEEALSLAETMIKNVSNRQ